MNAEPSSRTGTILVVDDESAVTGPIQVLLAKSGYDVYLAQDGVEGVKLASEVHPDLIILDITMPGMDGYEVAERLKGLPKVKDVPIIFLTGKSASEDGGKAFAKGGATFVRKPFSAKQLRDLVELAMQSVRE
ncbi:MAG TPA: response regulator [Candidatus Deferrimicrobium sp.]|nr:response regulator [Candidatus Deferrimicrobium sp.]